MTSIAIVVLDTLRYDAFESNFDWLDGMRFKNTYSTSHWTIPAHASLYTGYYPSEVGIHGKQMNMNFDGDTLPEIFQEHGYSTKLLTANPQIHMWDGWTRGYDTAIGPSNLSVGNESLVDWDKFYAGCDSEGIRKYFEAVAHCFKSDSPAIPSLWQGIKETMLPADGGIKSITQRVKETSFDGDDFIFINTMEAHIPYNPPKEYTDVDTPVDVVAGDAFSNSVTNPDELRDAYFASVEYLSDSYKELYENLSSDFDYVITTADHGEMLGEHGMWNHSYGIYPELVHVPLVISGDNIQECTINDVVSLLDVHKTVCDLAEMPVDSRGQNLLENIESRDYLFEYHGFLHWHREQFKRKGVSESIFDEKDSPLDGFVTQDGTFAYETHDDSLVTPAGCQLPDARSYLDNLLSEIDRKPGGYAESASDGISNEMRKQLEDLGYA